MTYKDSDFTEEITESTSIYIGSDIFVKVDWNIEDSKQLRFIISDCWVSLDESQHIDIVKNTCYSHTLGAKNLRTES